MATIVFINPPEPKGFGDAVLKAEPFIKEPFLVHAGDTYIISTNSDHLRRLVKLHDESRADATLILQEVKDPRQYGVVEGREVREGVYEVLRAIEKPEKPPTKLAIMPVYIFDTTIFEALKEISPGKDGEIQLTDGIQRLIDRGLKVFAIELKPDEIRIDIGSPSTYWEAIRLSHRYAI